jgi:integrase
MSLPARRTLRTRVLLESEIQAVWEAAETFGYPFGTHVKLLLMLGLRRGELTNATWKEFKLKDGSWTIPEKRSKSGVAHHIRLPKQALTMFKTLPHSGRRSDHFVFTTMGGLRPISFIAGFKIRLDKRCGVRDWTYHDLRRTMRTNLSRLKVPSIVADMALGHSRPEMHRVYDQYGYEDERAEALQRWANELERIVNPFPLFGSYQNS